MLWFYYSCVASKVYQASPVQSLHLCIGRFHVKGPRKKVNVKKWIFFNETWKIIGQIYDFDRFLNNSCILGVFLAKRRNKIKEWKTYFKYYIYHSYSMNFMILLICFVICNVLGHFYHFSDFHVFQYCEKCISLNAKPLSTFQYLN